MPPLAPGPRTPRSDRIGPRTSGLVLGLLAAAAAWPYLRFLRTWPITSDAAIWVRRGAWADPEWWSWVFETRHIHVGYRPLNALSFTFDHLLGGFSAWPYRGTDLLLHTGCGLLVYGLFRRIAPGRPRWAGWLASGLFLIHPLAESILPDLATRSYPLATLLSLAGLLVLIPKRDENPGRARSLGAGLLLALAVLANEVALLVVGVAPLLLALRLSSRSRWIRRALTGTLPAFVFAALGWGVRAIVVGGVGGYPPPPDRGERILPIAGATWQALGSAMPASPGEGGLAWPAVVAIGCVAAYYLVRILAGCVRGHSSESDRLAGLLFLWIAGYSLLYAPFGVWFPRQAYVAVVPFVLLVALLLAETARRRDRSPRRRVLSLAVQVFLIAWVVGHSPVVRDLDPKLVAAWRRSDSMLREVHATLSQLPDSSAVRLAIPFYQRPTPYSFRARDRRAFHPLGSRQPSYWMNTLLRDRGFLVKSAVVYEVDPLEDGAVLELREEADRLEILFAADARVHVFDPFVKLEGGEARGGRIARIEPIPRDSKHHFLYVHDGRRGHLLDEPRPRADRRPGRPGVRKR